MTGQQTYKLLGRTVKIVPDEGLPGRACKSCVFIGQGLCPSTEEEELAGIPESCIEGAHQYVEVQP